MRKCERGKEEGKEAEEGGGEQVKKDVTDWVEVRRRTRKKNCKMVQIFVKVNGPKATPMEVNLTDDKVEDVMRQIQKDEDEYVTMNGKVLRRDEMLKSCGVSDGCTIQVTSRMRGGGRYKDKKSKVEKKQVTGQEPVRNEGPVVLESEKEAVIRMLEENEEYRKIIKMFSEGSNEEYGIQYFTTELSEKSGLDASQMNVLECGLRWAVEAKRKKGGEEKRQQEQEEQRRQARREQSEQGKQVRFGDEEQFEETRAESTDEQKVTDGLAEVRTGRGSAGLVQRGDETHRKNETSGKNNETNGKGKGKWNRGKGEHGGKGEDGSKGARQVENLVMDEDQKNMRAMTSEEEEENHKEDVRMLFEMVEKEEIELEMMQKEEMEQGKRRGRVAPNMGAGGSQPQATSDPGKEEKEKKWTRVLSWADCNDEEVQENEEEVEQEKETRQRETTEERPPGLEEEVESESKTQQEKKPSQVGERAGGARGSEESAGSARRGEESAGSARRGEESAGSARRTEESAGGARTKESARGARGREETAGGARAKESARSARRREESAGGARANRAREREELSPTGGTRAT